MYIAYMRNADVAKSNILKLAPFHAINKFLYLPPSQSSIKLQDRDILEVMGIGPWMFSSPFSIFRIQHRLAILYFLGIMLHALLHSDFMTLIFTLKTI